ncbi:hypothetical protein ACGFIE_03605 [Micromonospora sp. NPDC049275]|uniref:hypothetical protein n=1 Tax=Micromonospora sp. NPDC049275 TaxID=3364268 RepID=UPI003710C70D
MRVGSVYRSISTAAASLAGGNPPVGSTNSIYGWGMVCYRGCSASSKLKTAALQVTSTDVTDAYNRAWITSVAGVRPLAPARRGWSTPRRPSAPRRFAASDQVNTAHDRVAQLLTASEPCWS